MRKPRIPEQPLKRRSPDRPFADMLMTVELRSTCCLRIIHVPDMHIFGPDLRLNLLHRSFITICTHNVIARNVGMAGIEANADRRMRAQRLQQFADLFETSAQRVLGPGRILNQNS